MPHVPTNADRLHDVLAKVGAGSTYVIHTAPTGAKRIAVTAPTGDRVVGEGPNTGAAIAALVAKVGGVKEAAS